MYPVCIKDDTSLKDGFVEVKFKPVSGRTDQAGGVIWRARDANNYYTARGNALEGTKAIECDDATFKDAGKVGVWTKADSVT